ncbi:hypothetical protein R3X25_00315 [Lutibacter sp. TH_r2]|uniref:hypothetical protein n=1 Tax=Lutibacter sp. TH_r2 TaxID=3082083 RepID=UPI002953BEC9|nr:hypothetical protein [Lutibacter sp. TH_r2]MDV7185707.1 hypothetical protein [Lutibacter sp. TH_r2]
MRVFEESQKFTQTWLMIVLIIGLIAPILTITNQWSEKTDKNLISNLDLLLPLVIFILVVSFILIIKLKTRIDKDGIKYQFYPIQLKYKTITWAEIEKAYVRKYNPISEYGGWGFKGGFFFVKRGIAYNISGNIGIQLELKSGKKLLIGTQLKEKAEQAINYNNKEND